MVRGHGRWFAFAMFALLCAACTSAGSHGESGGVGATPGRNVDLISRETLFEQPVIASPLLSPDGRWVSAVMPLNGVANFFVFPADDPGAARPVTHYEHRDVNPTDVSGNLTYFWTADGRHLVFLRDQDGDEKHHVMRVDIETGEIRDLTPIDGVKATIFSVSHQVPNEILVGMDDRQPGLFDLYRLNIETGERTLIERNEKYFVYFADNNLEPRIALSIEPTASGASLVQYYRAPGADWAKAEEFPLGAAQGEGDWPETFLGYGPDNRFARQIWTAGGDTDAVVEVDYDTGEQRVLARDARADIAEVLVHPQTNEVQAWVRHWTRREWVILDPALERDFAYLSSVRDGDLRIVSRSRDDRRWIVRYTLSDAPETFYIYERDRRRARLLFSTTPQLDGLPLVKMHPIVTPSSDGFELVSYYTLPFSADPDQDGEADAPVPFVVIIHGGPSDERAQFAFGPIIQMFGNRGYGVLYVNFRGSPGFGRRFMVAQNGEWGRAMSRDVDEQVAHIVADGLAIPDRVGVLGGSYGGYATLIAMTKSPETYACGVSLVGPSNLETFLANRPPEWSLDAWAVRIGDPRTAEGRALLRDRSPVYFADQARHPILIVQGANDRRVPPLESDQMVAALQQAGADVAYAYYPDEGHGLLRRPNLQSFYAMTEGFFAQCLGGRAEPIGDDLAQSSVEIRAGADLIPGLERALAERAAAQQGE